MLKKFQDFAIKGNAFDLAVGVIIGAAFGGIVESMVGDIFMPIVGAVTGGLDFSNYFVGLSKSVTAPSLAEAKKQGAVLAWGQLRHHHHQFRDHCLGAVHGGARHQQAGRQGSREAGETRRGAAPGGAVAGDPRYPGEETGLTSRKPIGSERLLMRRGPAAR